LALITVSLLAVTLNTWLNAKSGQLVSAGHKIDELTSINSRLNEDVELNEAVNARLMGDLEESQTLLAATNQEVSYLTEELENAWVELFAARRTQNEFQSDLSSKDTLEAHISDDELVGQFEKTYTEEELKAAIEKATAPLRAVIYELRARLRNSEYSGDNLLPDKQAISTAIETTRTDINKLSARLDREITVKGVQAAVGEAITATQATLEELAAQYENAPMGDDMQIVIADAISSTQASVDNLTERLNNSFTASGVQAAVAETIASTQAVFDELTSHLEN
jgi:N-methylhydantoinase B/oxoprolinase/acetone carboxylase alpha subunit